MEPIHGFTITGMRLAGFKCFPDVTEFAFDPLTLVTGGNGRGKSTIADAISFAIIGQPFFGEHGLDRLHSEVRADMFVTLWLTDHTGKRHELTRSRQSSRVTVTWDRREIRQSDLNILFGERDVFLSIFNPLYFIEELGNDGKKLLERYLPEIPPKDVLARLGEKEQAALRNESLLQPDVWLKNCRAEIRGLKDKITYLTGKKDLADTQRKEAAEKVRTLSRTMEELRGELSELEARQFDGLDADDIAKQLEDLTFRHQELSGEEPETADTDGIDRKLEALRRDCEKRASEWYTPQFADDIAAANAEAELLLEQYKKDRGALKGFQPGTVCPMCHRAVTENELPGVREAIQASMDAVVVKGKAAKARRDRLKEQERQAEAAFYAHVQADVERMNTEIQQLDEERGAKIQAAAEENEQRSALTNELLEKIRLLTAAQECGSLDEDDFACLKACREELRQTGVQLAAAQSVADAEPEDYDAQIAEIQREISVKEDLMRCVASFVEKKAEMLFSNLRMNRVEISLYDVVKNTGEAKAVFKFTYCGRRYDRLSLSEKIRAGMELSELMKRLTGRNYPQFIDNMESVDDLANVSPSGQVIMARCAHKADLSVRPAHRGQPRQAMAA